MKAQREAVKARMVDDLFLRYQECDCFACDETDMSVERFAEVVKLEGFGDHGVEIAEFLNSISGKEVDLVFTHGDAFEKNEDNTWLPNELWERV